MAALAGERCQALAHRTVEAFNKGGVEHRAALGATQQKSRPPETSMGHATSDFHHPFLDASFDHGANDQLRPEPQARTSASRCLLHLLSERPFDPVWLWSPAISTYQPRYQRLPTPSLLYQPPIPPSSNERRSITFRHITA